MLLLIKKDLIIIRQKNCCEFKTYELKILEAETKINFLADYVDGRKTI